MPKTQGRCKVPPCMSHEWAIFSKRNRIAFNAVSHEKLTNDGLIRCSDMVGFEQDEPKYLWFRDEQSVVAYPNEYCSSIFKYICENEYLSKFSALRMVSGQGIFGRACMFGVPFERSLLNVIDQGFVKAEYYLPDQQDNVYYASLLFHLNRRKESNRSAIELQVWQYCPGLSEVFYIHAESNDFLNYYTVSLEFMSTSLILTVN